MRVVLLEVLRLEGDLRLLLHVAPRLLRVRVRVRGRVRVRRSCESRKAASSWTLLRPTWVRVRVRVRARVRG